MTSLSQLPPLVHETLLASLDVLAKATVLILLALAINALLRGRRRVLARSAVFNALLAGLVLLPAASLAFPRLRVPCLPAMTEPPAPAVVAPPLQPAPLPEIARSEKSARVRPPRTWTPMSDVRDADNMDTSALSEETAATTAAAPVHVAAAPTPAPGPPLRPFPWLMCVWGVYLAGVVLLVARLLASLNAVRRLRRTGQPLTDPAWTNALARWQTQLGIDGRVQLATSPAVTVPLTFGWLQPIVMLPESLTDALDARQREAVLLHELAHVRRGDYAWQLLLKLVQAAYWVHPLVWLVGRWVSAAREQACDDLCAYHAATPQDYRATLVEVVSRLVRRPAISLGIAMANTTKIAKRLERIDAAHRCARCVAGRPARVLVTALALGMAAAIGPIELARRAAAQPVRPVLAPPTPEQPPATGVRGAPMFRCDEPVYTFPDAWAGDVVEHTWIVHNDGDAVLEILEVKPDCGCMRPEYDKQIPPGGQGKITVKLNTRGLRNEVTKNIAVRTNVPNDQPAALQSKGKVNQRILMDPPNGAVFPQVPPEANPTQTVTLTRNTDKPLKLERGPMSVPVPFTYEVKEVEAGKVFQVIVTADKTKLKEGANYTQLALKTDIMEEPTFFVPVRLTVPPVIQVSPTSLAVATPVGAVFHRVVTLTYKGPAPMQVTGVSATDPGIEVQAAPVGAGQSWRLIVDIPVGWSPSPIQSPATAPAAAKPPIEVIVRTDVKEKPEVRIRLYTYPQQNKLNPNALIGQPAPQVTIKDNNGNDFKLGAATGRVAVTAFFASWCPHCRRMLPQLQEIAKSYAAKGVDFNLVSLDQKATSKEVATVLDDLGITLPYAVDARQVAGSKYGANKFPMTFVIGKNAAIEAVNSGAPKDFAEVLTAQLDLLLAGKDHTSFPARLQPKLPAGRPAAPPSSEATRRLGFAILPTMDPATGDDRPTNEQIAQLLADLQTTGPEPGHKRKDEYQWFEATCDLPPESITGHRDSTAYVLLHVSAGTAILPKQGLGTIGLLGASAGKGQDRATVDLTLDRDTGLAFRELTKNNLNKPLAAMIDDRVVMQASIRSEIGAQVQISGNFTQEQAEELVAELSAADPTQPATRPSTRPANDPSNRAATGDRAPIADPPLTKLEQAEAKAFVEMSKARRRGDPPSPELFELASASARELRPSPTPEALREEDASDSSPASQPAADQKTGRVEGVARIGAHTYPGAEILMNPYPWVLADARMARPGKSEVAITDAQGRFSFDHVPVGEVFVSLRVNDVAEGLDRTVYVDPGRTTRADLGGTGRPVIGRFMSPPGYTGKIDWKASYRSLGGDAGRPPFPQELSQDALLKWYENYRRSPEARARNEKRRSYGGFSVTFDGSFRIEDVIPGQYHLEVRLKDHLDARLKDAPDRQAQREAGRISREITVPEIPGGRSDEPMDLGTLVAELPAAAPSASATQPAMRAAAETRFGRLEGVARIGARPYAGAEILLSPSFVLEGQSHPRTTADAQGRFAFDHIPAGEAQLYLILDDRREPGFSPAEAILRFTEVKPGETTRADLGGTGRPVIGRLAPPAGVDKIDWVWSVRSLYSSARVPYPHGLSPENQKAWYAEYQKSPAGRARLEKYRGYGFKVKSDGTFRIEDVNPGDYWLSVDVYASKEDELGKHISYQDRLALVTEAISVPEIPGGRTDEPLDLGTLIAKPATTTQPSTQPAPK